jgi:hypothetical protein
MEKVLYEYYREFSFWAWRVLLLRIYLLPKFLVIVKGLEFGGRTLAGWWYVWAWEGE